MSNIGYTMPGYSVLVKCYVKYRLYYAWLYRTCKMLCRIYAILCLAIVYLYNVMSNIDYTMPGYSVLVKCYVQYRLYYAWL